MLPKSGYNDHLHIRKDFNVQLVFLRLQICMYVLRLLLLQVRATPTATGN